MLNTYKSNEKFSQLQTVKHLATSPIPLILPSKLPTKNITIKPTIAQSKKPTVVPTRRPQSTVKPATRAPTFNPSQKPTIMTTMTSTVQPSAGETTRSSLSFSYYSAQGNQIIDSLGNPLRISAVNW